MSEIFRKHFKDWLHEPAKIEDPHLKNQIMHLDKKERLDVCKVLDATFFFSIFDAMKLQKFLEMVEIVLQHF